MKKIFTLFAVAAMAITGSAQEKEWNISNWDDATYTAETTIDGFTVYATDKGTVAIDANNKTVDGVKYTKRLKTGGAGSKGEDGVLSRVLSFDVPSNGTVSFIAASSNSSDDRVVGVAFDEFKAFPAEGDLPAGLTAIDVLVGNPAVKTVEYTGGKATKVYIYSKSGGVNFYDFKFTPSAGGDTPAPAEGETFTVKGAGSGIFDKEFDEIVTPFEFDVKAMEGTFNNFLGGTTTVKLKWEITNPNKDPQETGAMYDSTPISGLGEVQTVAGYYKMCNINDFTGSVIIKQDGVNFGKLDNILVGVDFSSQIAVVTVDGKRYYEVNIMLGGDYSTWNAEKSEWTTSGSNYIKLVKNIPLSGGQTGAIDAIAADVDEDAPVEYYNIQGMRVANPTPGQLVIRRQGNKTSKVIFR